MSPGGSGSLQHVDALHGPELLLLNGAGLADFTGLGPPWPAPSAGRFAACGSAACCSTAFFWGVAA
eukprot:CAMPEP_0204524156 /NCGR_PEP_ID=MMETSP0661-20131031/7227_1 /ASSEMBLY_ACC=CAM_ASM_000606 /TAXON_ID=109239 /ORGANISM="Alexandrium margalefi, Strain AMGDE01CS-322" /LENGTH=65 /DNA_ID=CAMNT_0051529893 /DNA_START=167 /DNA_END=362 /DNA_ORIENTATION=+